MTIEGRRSLSLATASSERIVNTASDQPSTRVWPDSMTNDRPLRSSSSFSSSAVAITPMSADTTNRPPSVTASITTRNGHPPPSPATVRGSRACMSVEKTWPTKP